MTRYGTSARLPFSLIGSQVTAAEQPLAHKVVVTSRDGRNAITIDAAAAKRVQLRYTIVATATR